MPTSPPLDSTIGGRRGTQAIDCGGRSLRFASGGLMFAPSLDNGLPERGKQKAQRKALAFQADSVVGSLASPQFRGFLLPYSHESPPTNKHQRAPYEETEVPINPLILRHGFVDVVNTQQVMVDDTFDQIKQAETNQHRSPEQLAGPAHMRSMRRTPQDDEAQQDKNIRGRVKEAIPKRIDLKVLHAVGRIPGTGEHMVPLKHLMQDNPVEEAPEPEPEQNPRGVWKFSIIALIVDHISLLKTQSQAVLPAS
jgi:hypothetical protein